MQLLDILNSEKIIQHYAVARNEHSKPCQLLLKKWRTLKELIYVLRIPFNATIEFQSQRLNLSDVYHRWTVMQLHLKKCTSNKKYETQLAHHMLEALIKRSENIFKNPLMASALYLDPRFHKIIARNQDKVEEAKQNILKIGRRMLYLRSKPINNDSKTSNDSLSFEFDEQEAMMEHLQGESPIQPITSGNVCQKDNFDIEIAVETFQPESLLPNESVLNYWESVKEEHEELYEIAMVIYSVPPTEVQIERDFSSLGFVFSDRRTSMSHARLEDIMLLFLNKELFDIVCKNEIEAAIKNQNQNGM